MEMFFFQAGAISVLLLKMPLYSFSLEFQVVNNFPILHLDRYTICLKAVLMLLVGIKLSKHKMKKKKRSGKVLFALSSPPMDSSMALSNSDFSGLPTNLSRCHL